jgi:hypothetical protein
MAARARDGVARRKLGVADMFAVGRDCDTWPKRGRGTKTRTRNEDGDDWGGADVGCASSIGRQTAAYRAG